MKIILIIFILAIPTYSQSLCDWKCKTSVGIYSLGLGIDSSSSWGKKEKNSIIRDSDMIFSPSKYFTIHTGVISSTLLLDKYFEKHNPKMKWATFGLRTGIGILLIRQGIKNF